MAKVHSNKPETFVKLCQVLFTVVYHLLLRPGRARLSSGVNWLPCLAAVVDFIPQTPTETKDLPKHTFGSSLLPG